MMENNETKAVAEVKAEPVKVVYTPLQKSIGVGILAGLTSGVLYYIYESLCPETKDRIKEQVINAVKAQIPKLVIVSPSSQTKDKD
jgi:hypothetical protein